MLGTFLALVLAILTWPRASQANRLRHQSATPLFNKRSVSEDLLSRCDKRWFTTSLDHFSRSVGPKNETSFRLRYYVCDEHYDYEKADHTASPIFFYLGNEADVLLYLNASGLMWENAESFGAMLIFAEHRYYGESLPFGHATRDHMSWLSAEQALADYVTLLQAFKADHDIQGAPVIGFGGSYGGMLGTWARLKYPHVWQGIIAGSAPIWTFMGEQPSMDPSFYAKGVTYDTTEEAGAAPGCTTAIRMAFSLMIKVSRLTKDGSAKISDALRICPAVQLNSTANVTAARDWAAAAFDMMAMGNYPYASSYMLNGNGELPAFPMRVACKAVMDELAKLTPDQQRLAQALPFAADKTVRALDAVSELGTAQPLRGVGAISTLSRSQRFDDALLDSKVVTALMHGLSSAAGIWYNYTGEDDCFNPWKGVNEETAHDGDFWDYQYCTEMFMPFKKTGVTDMFWSEPWNDTAAREACQEKWGVEPRELWATAQWGGRDLSSLSNVVFSNGLFDPWHGGGVLTNLSESVTAVIIPEGGHHLDLMFSTDDDPDSLRAARAHQLSEIRKWIDEHHARYAKQLAQA